MKTIAQLIIGIDGQAKFDAMSARAGMTPEECAAATHLQGLAASMTAEHRAVLADPAKGKAAIARVALLPAGDDVQDRFARTLAAILN